MKISKLIEKVLYNPNNDMHAVQFTSHWLSHRDCESLLFFPNDSQSLFSRHHHVIGDRHVDLRSAQAMSQSLTYHRRLKCRLKMFNTSDAAELNMPKNLLLKQWAGARLCDAGILQRHRNPRSSRPSPTRRLSKSKQRVYVVLRFATLSLKATAQQ